MLKLASIYVPVSLLLLVACDDSGSPDPKTNRRDNRDLGVLQSSLQGPSPITVPAQFVAGDLTYTVSLTTVNFPRMFALDETEVTISQYTECVGAEFCTPPATGGDCNWGVGGRDQHPVNCVDFGQAVTYCAWAGKRLPTRHEWEYAGRFNDGRIYPWGNSSSGYATKANTNSGDAYSTTAPVGSFPAGDTYLGLKDMGGNVYEWTQSARCIWETGPCNNCPSDEECDNACDVCGYVDKTIRGGSWNHAASASKVVGDTTADITLQSAEIGFRCAVTIR